MHRDRYTYFSQLDQLMHQLHFCMLNILLQKIPRFSKYRNCLGIIGKLHLQMQMCFSIQNCKHMRSQFQILTMHAHLSMFYNGMHLGMCKQHMNYGMKHNLAQGFMFHCRSNLYHINILEEMLDQEQRQNFCTHCMLFMMLLMNIHHKYSQDR